MREYREVIVEETKEEFLNMVGDSQGEYTILSDAIEYQLEIRIDKIIQDILINNNSIMVEICL